MRLETEKHEEQWERRQRLYEFEINQLEERAKFESTEMGKLRKDNQELKNLREEERLKRSQEVEKRNNVGCVTSQGVMLVVQDLIDTTRWMKQQLGQTLIKETQIKMETREITETTKEIEVLPETREIDRVGTELNKMKEETETKIQEEAEVMNEVTELKETQRETQEVEEMIMETTAEMVMETKETGEVTEMRIVTETETRDRGWIK